MREDRHVTRPDERPDRTRRGTRGGGHARTAGPRPGADRAGADRPRRVEPPLPEDVTGHELDRAVRAELSSLARINADIVARHLVMAGRLLGEDPELAYEHARAAQGRAGRVGAVREAAGLAAYATGRFAEALSELRAARRISGDDSLLPVLADCERGLGRPERALALATSPEMAGLDAGARVEMLIVASGARRDLGQHEAAVQTLRGPQLKPSARRPWSARLFYAYADALLGADRLDEAVEWFGYAADADADGATDAGERLAALQGIAFTDVVDDPDEDGVPLPPEDA
jgi:tetratricopeptide (TPR) repeat protein